jgi:hypothetical protein
MNSAYNTLHDIEPCYNVSIVSPAVLQTIKKKSVSKSGLLRSCLVNLHRHQQHSDPHAIPERPSARDPVTAKTFR